MDLKFLTTSLHFPFQFALSTTVSQRQVLVLVGLTCQWTVGKPLNRSTSNGEDGIGWRTYTSTEDKPSS